MKSYDTSFLVKISGVALAAAVFPLIISNPYYLNIANIIGLNAVIVIGLNLLIGYAGQISLGHAAFYGIGAYVSGILSVNYGVNPWLALVIAVFATGTIAFLIGIPTLKLHGHYLVMATLGFNIIVNIIIVQWDSMTGGPSGFSGIPNLAIGGFNFDSDFRMYYLILAAMLIGIIVARNLIKSRAGRALRALHGSDIAANSFGVPTGTYKIKVFVLSAAYASVAGSLYAHYLTFISPKTFDIFFSVELVTMVIVGGMGNLWGSLAGTAFLTSLPNVLHFFDEYKDIFYGLILVTILIFVPEGLFVGIRRGFLSLKRSKSDNGTKLDLCRRHGEIRFLPASNVTRNSGKPVLDVHGICKSFGGVCALSDVSLSLPPGSITSVIGPNGAGKTTLINIISGVLKPDSGYAAFGNTDIRTSKSYQLAQHGLTRTFQNNRIFPHLSVKENVMVGLHGVTKNGFVRSVLRLPGFRKEERFIDQRSREVLEFFGLLEYSDQSAGSLPYGIQKKIEIARALAPYPKLILLDEPVAGLNMTESLEIAKLISRIRSAGITILLVEHDMNLVMRISDHVIVLNYGRKIAEGSPREIQKNQEVLTAYLGSVA